MYMGNRKVTFSENEFYHVYNRGTDKRKVFLDQADYYRFIQLLYLTNTTSSINVRDITKLHSNVFDWKRPDVLVAIGTYCLMPNHFHILLTPHTDDGVKNFMLKLSTGYSMYFNKKYFRTGSLFEGRFKSEYVNEDRYLKYLFSYIHLNPVKLIQSDWREQGIKNMNATLNYLNTYQYSSYLDHEYSRQQSAVINRKPFPNYFDTKSAVDKELTDWLSYKEAFTKARPS